MSPLPASSLILDACVERFELARRVDPTADLAAFLPEPSSTDYLEVLCELVRIDLEMSWARRQPVPLAEYRRRFPLLFEDRRCRQTVTFEEDRLRRQAGEGSSRSTKSEATPVLSMSRCSPAQAFPAVGEDFAGFRLLAELGRGAVGRVYLACQGELANRPVVLKIAADLFDEPHTLAQLQHTHIVPIYSWHRFPERAEAGGHPLQAVCMPFLGSTTFAGLLRWLHGRPAPPTTAREVLDWLAQQPEAGGPGPGAVKEVLACPLIPEKRSGVELMLWLAARLAEGLDHAHQRGILHLDLKPANLLLTREGQPLLLDFNLAQDVKSSSRRGVIGGTLPYMAPELLEAYAGQAQALDGRADVFSLGVILFELLTGKRLFEEQPGVADQVAEQLRLRRRPLPALRGQAITPAVAAIVQRCLQPAPAQRYASARHLAEDLEAQLNQQPLRHQPEPSAAERLGKWLRRHPRLTSSAGVALLAGSLLVGLGALLLVREQRLQRLESAKRFEQFGQLARWAQFDLLDGRSSDPVALERGVQRAHQALAQYSALTDPHWLEQPAVRALSSADQERLRQETGDLLLLWSRLNERLAGQDRPAEQRQALQRSALDLKRRAERVYLPGQAPDAGAGEEALASSPASGPSLKRAARGLRLRAGKLAWGGRNAPDVPGAVALLREAIRIDPQDLWSWFELGLCQEHLGQDADAGACFETCIALAPSFTPLYFKRGLAALRQRQFASARRDFERVLAEQPDLQEARINRALAGMDLGDTTQALADLDTVLEQGTPYTRVWFLRAQLRERLGDSAGARADRAEGLRLPPVEELSWLARGQERLDGDPAGAFVDFAQALHLNPRSRPALRNQAYLLAEKLNRPADALAALDRLLGLDSSDLPARASRGVLLARLGRRPEAAAEAKACLARPLPAAVLHQVASIYALTGRTHPEDRALALHLLATVAAQGIERRRLENDPDLKTLGELPAFQQILATARK